MKKSFIKRIIIFVIFASFMMQSFSYAKTNPFERQEFDRPTADKKTLQSDNTIIDNSGYHEYNPLNPIPSGIDKEEYDKVNNYNVDLETLESRIKYFSPAYLSIKKGAESSLWMALYATGGSTISNDTFRSSLIDVKDTISEYAKLRDEKKRELSAYKKTESPSAAHITELTNAILTYDAYCTNYKSAYSDALASINMVEKMAGHSKRRYSIATVDNNHQVANARMLVTKSLRSLVLNYIKLDYSIKVLNEQVNLNKNIYDTYLRNYNNGVATALEVSSKLNDYEKSKNTYKSTYTIYKNLKEQICINLGYDLNDIDKLNFVEPEVDLDYIKNINIDEDRDKAYNSNASYTGISIGSKDRKLPGSTGEEIFNKRKTYAASKVIVALEDAYRNLEAAIWTYNGASYLDEIAKINEGANIRKKQNDLVSDVEYLGLELQNLSYKLQVKNAKYDLIMATDNYYYATMGNLNV